MDLLEDELDEEFLSTQKISQKRPGKSDGGQRGPTGGGRCVASERCSPEDADTDDPASAHRQPPHRRDRMLEQVLIVCPILARAGHTPNVRVMRAPSEICPTICLREREKPDPELLRSFLRRRSTPSGEASFFRNDVGHFPPQRRTNRPSSHRREIALLCSRSTVALLSSLGVLFRWQKFQSGVVCNADQGLERPQPMNSLVGILRHGFVGPSGPKCSSGTFPEDGFWLCDVFSS
ncbi:hypothetical protein BIW11_04805 [Tropilaelaps mercedesae]|uniref:Uncharacterized protein n=1 Tax=Tropilaelaps mercedesae TaxID=418985 RepID=A0A1V9X203_9ACAR|nr:hypothetical protein BIW11_04805 [Tropilaelaps mercedesae]